MRPRCAPLFSNAVFVRYGISHALSSCLDLLACLFVCLFVLVVCLSVVLQVGVVKVVFFSFDDCEFSKGYKLEGAV